MISHEISPSTSPADQGLKGDTCNRDTDTTGCFCLLLCIHSFITFCSPFLSYDSCFPVCLLLDLNSPFFFRFVIFLCFSYFQVASTFSVSVISLFLFSVSHVHNFVTSLPLYFLLSPSPPWHGDVKTSSQRSLLNLESLFCFRQLFFRKHVLVSPAFNLQAVASEASPRVYWKLRLP